MTHNIIAYFHKYDWLCHLATFYNSVAIGMKKGGQVTKPIIATCENMLAIILCVIQGVRNI